MSGHVVFEVDGACFAVEVGEVAEVVRGDGRTVLPDPTGDGSSLSLCDVRGRTVPVVDLRRDRARPGEVLLPADAEWTGVVVDRVLAVLPEGALNRENGAVAGLPAYVRGVLRPGAGGVPGPVSGPVLLVSLSQPPMAVALAR